MMPATVSQMGSNTLLQRIQATRLERDDANRRLAALEAEYNNQLNQALPVSRIPPDVLVSIFQEVQSKMDGDKLPVEIYASHVCSSWRRVVIETPILWSNIALHHAFWLGGQRITWWNGSQILDLYTSRFKNCPLKISFRFIGAMCEEYLRVLVPFMAQWQHLDLGSDLAKSDDKVWELLSPSTTPLLESLHLHYHFGLLQNHCLLPTASYPALKVLTVYSPPDKSWSPSFLNLTTLALGHPEEILTYACLEQMLTSLPHLVNFSLASFVEPESPHHTPGSGQPTITHLNLRFIELCDFSNLHWMADNLILPKLHTVELCDFLRPSHPRQFQNTSFPSVQSLIIRYVYPWHDTLEDVEIEEGEEYYFYDAFLVFIFPNITKLAIDAQPRFAYLNPSDYHLLGNASEDRDEQDEDPEHDASCVCDSCTEYLEEEEEEAGEAGRTLLPVLPFSLAAVPHETSMHIPWPHLQTLVLGDMDCLQDDPRSDTLILDLHKRKTMDRGVRKVVVPRNTRSTWPGHWRVLSKIAEVEEVGWFGVPRELASVSR